MALQSPCNWASKVTKPNPRHRPVTRSVITTTSVILPDQDHCRVETGTSIGQIDCEQGVYNYDPHKANPFGLDSAASHSRPSCQTCQSNLTASLAGNPVEEVIILDKHFATRWNLGTNVEAWGRPPTKILLAPSDMVTTNAATFGNQDKASKTLANWHVCIVCLVFSWTCLLWTNLWRAEILRGFELVDALDKAPSPKCLEYN